MGKRSKNNNGTHTVQEDPAVAENSFDEVEHEKPEELDNPLRVVVLVNSPEVPDGDLQERLMDYVQSMEDVDAFFDDLDEKVCIPNEEHIKYEVGSDGLVVIVVDSKDLAAEVVKFIDDYNEKIKR